MPWLAAAQRTCSYQGASAHLLACQDDLEEGDVGEWSLREIQPGFGHRHRFRSFLPVRARSDMPIVYVSR